VESPTDILEELTALVQCHADHRSSMRQRPDELSASTTLDTDTRRILQALTPDLCHPDILQQGLQLDWPSLQSRLLDLELRGLIERQDGYVRRMT
jgi:predicted Rossmann fold nucleotide-binding protein DprA/Smf involved in DNA uptake